MAVVDGVGLVILRFGSLGWWFALVWCLTYFVDLPDIRQLLW